jgi:hypothetical protein
MDTHSIFAGAAKALLPLLAGLPLGGYVMDSRDATEPNDSLEVRALAIKIDERVVVIVSFDLLYGSASITARLRELVAAAHGLDADSVLVNGTHTHCAPRDITARTNPTLVNELAESGAQAVTSALTALEPVRIISGVSEGIDIGRNRRSRDGFVDHSAQLVLFESIVGDTPTGRVVASIINLACHPVVLDDETASYHPDFVGPLRDSIDRSIGGITLFLQGFSGDTNPVVIEHTVIDTARVGALVAAPVMLTLAEMLSTGRQPTVYNLSERQAVPVDLPGGTVHTGPLSTVRTHVTVEQRALGPVTRAGASASAISIEEWISALYREQDDIFNSMDMVAANSSPLDLEVQSIAIGDDLLIVAFPGEPLGESRREIVAGLPGKRVLTVGYSNGSPGYIPYEAAYAHSGYEVGCSIVVPGTAERLVAACLDAQNPSN